MEVTGIIAGIVAALPFTTPKYEVKEVIARLLPVLSYFLST